MPGIDAGLQLVTLLQEVPVLRTEFSDDISQRLPESGGLDPAARGDFSNQITKSAVNAKTANFNAITHKNIPN
jgi:hypothetical protein